MTQVPVAEGILTGPPDAPELLGSRCGACGIVTFPAQDSCPRCASTDMAEHALGRRGRLWAWTTQHFPPPSPPYAGPTGADFVPFGVGYVELTRFARLNAGPAEAELSRAANVIAIAPDEVAQLDADPNFPEHGQLAIDMRGGR